MDVRADIRVDVPTQKLSRGPKMSETISEESPESQEMFFETSETLLRLFWTLFGPWGRTARETLSKTLWGHWARRTRETPASGGRDPNPMP